MENRDDAYYMQLALKEAQKAFELDEVPVGAVLVQNHQILARSHNQVELLQDATAHAEILALTAAFSMLGSKYVPDATLYITLEPCLMCAGALYWSKIGKVVYAASDPKNGFSHHCPHQPFHPKTILSSGIMAEDSTALLKEFFRKKRNN